MKKLMIAAAIVCAAAFAQAASITWSVTGSTNPWQDDDILAADGFAAYFFVDSASLGGATATYSYSTALASIQNGVFDFADKAVGTPGAFNYGATTVQNVGSFNNGASAESLNNIVGYLVITGNDGEGNNYLYISDTKSTSINALGGSDTLKFGNLDAHSRPTDEVGSWYAAAAVPEPTSGLLLLLGVAGLALRRRRA